MKEEWKEIPGYEGFYKASNTGKIFSYYTNADRVFSNGVYPMVLLSKNGFKKMITVHSLIILTFVGPRPKGLHINHKDGNKYNNNVSNLEYVTISQNMRHSFDVLGRRVSRSNLGRFNGDSYRSVKVNQFTKDGLFIKTYGCVREASKLVSGSETAISNCLNGRCKTSSGFIWKYVSHQ